MKHSYTLRRFQSRFNDAFLRGVPNLGPQDIEAGVVADPPSEAVEDLLCGLLGLVLNRKKNPEYECLLFIFDRAIIDEVTSRRGHYGRALEEALASQKPQWPPHWNGINPVPSSKTFAHLSPERRVCFFSSVARYAVVLTSAASRSIS